MSRVGKMPIKVPEKVKVTIQGDQLLVEGPLGKLQRPIDPQVEVSVNQGVLTLKTREPSRQAGCRHGLMRNLIRNMVEGVSQGFKKELEITGVGYRAEVKGDHLNLSLGFSHPVEFPIPHGIKVQVEKLVKVLITGASKEDVGETAARIRKIRPPEPYKGKGVKYLGEVIQRKVGKSAVASGGGK